MVNHGDASDTVLARDPYIGSTREELAARSRGDRFEALLSQKALFPRQGTATLLPDRLVLDDWNGDFPLIIQRSDVISVSNEYTSLYGRFIGGLLESGKPLILQLASGQEIYLLLNRRGFSERTDDPRWTRLLREWLA
jgi:hypothetical protein